MQRRCISTSSPPMHVDFFLWYLCEYDVKKHISIRAVSNEFSNSGSNPPNLSGLGVAKIWIFWIRSGTELKNNVSANKKS